MTESVVRETLREVRDGVDVPLIDHVGFTARTRRLRRRRRALQALGGGVAVAAVVGAIALPGALSRPDSVVAAPAPSPGVPVVLDGQVQLVRGDGTLTPTGHGGTPVGVLDGELVWVEDGVLTGPGGARTEGVRAAYVTDAGIAYQAADGAIHLPGEPEPAASDGALVAAEGTTYVTEQDDVLTLHTEGETHVLPTGSDAAVPPIGSVELGNGTVVVTTGEVVSFFDLDGARLGGFLGGVTGALSPDGATYAYATSARERRQGMAPGLTLHDVATDRSQRVPVAGDAVDLAWAGEDLVVLVDRGDARVLLECTDAGCDELLTDPSGTLSLQ